MCRYSRDILSIFRVTNSMNLPIPCSICTTRSSETKSKKISFCLSVLDSDLICRGSGGRQPNISESDNMCKALGFSVKPASMMPCINNGDQFSGKSLTEVWRVLSLLVALPSALECTFHKLLKRAACRVTTIARSSFSANVSSCLITDCI